MYHRCILLLTSSRAVIYFFSLNACEKRSLTRWWFDKHVSIATFANIIRIDRDLPERFSTYFVNDIEEIDVIPEISLRSALKITFLMFGKSESTKWIVFNDSQWFENLLCKRADFYMSRNKSTSHSNLCHTMDLHQKWHWLIESSELKV